MLNFHNYNQLVCDWWWGKTITLIHHDGIATVELQKDNNYSYVYFLKGLMVHSMYQRKGYGTEMMAICEDIARKEKIKFLQLSANKNDDMLYEWYHRLGFEIYSEDEHEYTMIKFLGCQK